MSYSLADLKLSRDEIIWLDEICKKFEEGEEIRRREIMVALYPKLSRDFDPKKIDSRIYTGTRPTLFGLSLVNPNSKLLERTEKVIFAIKAVLMKKPNVIGISAKELSVTLNVEATEIARIFTLLSDIGQFWSSASGTLGTGYSDIHVEGEPAFNSYLRFNGLRDIFDGMAANILSPPAVLPKAEWIPSVPQQRFEPNTAFIIMSMDPDTPEFEDVCNSIKEACSEHGIRALRADDIEHSGKITDMILAKIESSEFIFADVTGERPNVYYEIGYAHAIGKRPHIFRKAGTPLHFDLSVHNAPAYKNITDLRDRLRKRLEEILGKSEE